MRRYIKVKVGAYKIKKFEAVELFEYLFNIPYEVKQTVHEEERNEIPKNNGKKYHCVSDALEDGIDPYRVSHTAGDGDNRAWIVWNHFMYGIPIIQSGDVNGLQYDEVLYSNLYELLATHLEMYLDCDYDGLGVVPHFYKEFILDHTDKKTQEFLTPMFKEMVSERVKRLYGDE